VLKLPYCFFREPMKKNAIQATPLLVVVGAGPKAAALAAKARVLRELGLGEIRIKVLEREKKMAANWTGSTGFTTGKVQLCTPPEKDVGFPYSSIFGSEVDKKMLVDYSWHAYKILLGRSLYSDWVDAGREHPTHEEWANYLRDILMAQPRAKSDVVSDALAGDDIVSVHLGTTVEQIEPENGNVRISAVCGGHKKSFEADGVVLTGPGRPIVIENSPTNAQDLIFNGQDYWRSTELFNKMKAGKIAVIGGGETAASIVLSLLELTQGSSVGIDIINRHGAIFTRGESYNESRRFSNPKDWLALDIAQRRELISRTDRGVFSVTAQRRLNKARNVDYQSGEVVALSKDRKKVNVHLKRGNSPEEKKAYDRVIVALGFNPWTSLDFLPSQFRPSATTQKRLMELYADLELTIDHNLCLTFDHVPSMKNVRFNIHMPMVAGLAQGPGFPNLCSLGHMSDRIISRYIGPPARTRKG
jgi:mycobactin lysine-N-oxygenase